MGRKYKVTVHTGNVMYAGTDSDVTLVMHGIYGFSDAYCINSLISGNALERNALETIYIDVPKDLGDIYKIEVQSDCSWAGSDWLLDYFEIKRMKNDNENNVNFPTCHFAYNNWITDTSKKEIYVSDGLNIETGYTTEIETIKSGHKIKVTANSEFKYKESISVSWGYSLDEATISEIGTSTKISAGLKKDSLKDAIDFTLTSKNTSKSEQSQSIKYDKTVDVEYIFPKCDKATVYELLITRQTKRHTISFGNSHIEVPEIFSSKFAGFVEVSE